MEGEKRYRLRRAQKIVGYCRELPTGTTFYSKDSFWWTGYVIPYTQLDEWTGWRDKNRTLIYEYDIVKCKLDPDGEFKNAAVLWHAKEEEFCLRILSEDSLHFPLEMSGIAMFNPKEIQVYSHLFLNPEIMDELGVKDD
jgi:hypothetical protein